MTLVFKAKDTIEFIGDSITDCDRNQASPDGLGTGYVHNIHHLLQAGYPELQLSVINKGVSGNQITDLKTRWDQDVMTIKPDWLFIYIGINDVWRYFEGNGHETISLSTFEKTYRQLLNETQEKIHAQINLVSPFLAEKNPSDPFLNKLAQYQLVIDALGKDFSLPVIHLQPAFDWAMLSRPSSFWASDRVHPTSEGHMLIALTVLRVCGFGL